MPRIRWCWRCQANTDPWREGFDFGPVPWYLAPLVALVNLVAARWQCEVCHRAG